MPVHAIDTATKAAQMNLAEGLRIEAEAVAGSAVRCLKDPRFEVYPYRSARLVPFFRAISATLTARLLRHPEYHRRQVVGPDPTATPHRRDQP